MSQMDLGNVLGTIGGFIPGTDLFDVGSALVGAFQNSPVAPTTNLPATTQPTGAPRMNTPSCSHNGTYRVVSTIDAATGQVVKQTCAPKRRRRKRLATSSDIRDLGALKAILGNGENFKMWIATSKR